MGEEVNAGNVRVAFKGDLEGLLQGIEQVKTGVHQIVPDLKDQFMELGKSIGAAFTVAELVRFSKESVQRFATVQKSSYLLSQQLRNTGASTKDYANSLKYAEEAERAFEVDKVQVMDSLRQLATITGNAKDAMGLNTLAMKVSKVTGDSLADSSYKLGLAFQGDERATKYLGKEFGVVGEKGKDVRQVFEAIEKKTVDLDPKIKNFTKSWHDFSTTIEDAKEDLGKFLSGPLQGLMDQISSGHKFQKDLNEALKQENFLIRKNAIDAQYTRDQAISGELQARPMRDKRIQQLVADYRKELEIEAGKRASSAATLAAKAVQNQKERDLDQEKINLAKEEKQIIEETMLAVKAAGTERTNFETEISKKTITAMDLLQGLSDKVVNTTRKEGETVKEWSKRIKKDITEMEDVARAKAEALAQFSHSISDTISTDFQAFVANIKAGNATLMDSFAVLGKAILKSLVGSLGDVLVQKGAADLIEGFADLLNPAKMALAPGFFASGAALSAGGGSLKGLAAGMAFGGGAFEPALRPFAEREPEIAVPLSKLKTDSTFGPALAHAAGMGGGGMQIGRLDVHVNGVKDASGFSSTAVRQTISRALIEANDNMRYRSGKRLSTRG